MDVDLGGLAMKEEELDIDNMDVVGDVPEEEPEDDVDENEHPVGDEQEENPFDSLPSGPVEDAGEPEKQSKTRYGQRYVPEPFNTTFVWMRDERKEGVHSLPCRHTPVHLDVLLVSLASSLVCPQNAPCNKGGTGRSKN